MGCDASDAEYNSSVDGEKGEQSSGHDNSMSVLVHAGSERREPGLSILIPTFRRPALLQSALASAVKQDSIHPFEVVVVDNEQEKLMASDVDAIISQASAPNLRLYRNKMNLGMFGNWNRCISLARGPWFTILCDDDLLLPGFVETVFQTLESYPYCEYVQTNFLVGKTPIRSNYQSSTAHRACKVTLVNTYKTILHNDRFGGLGIVYLKKKALALGGFDHAYYPISDYEFNLRYLHSSRQSLQLCANLAFARMHKNTSGETSTVLSSLSKTVILRGKMLSEKGRVSFINKVYLWCSAVANYHYSVNQWGVQPDMHQFNNDTGMSIPTSRFLCILARIARKVLMWYLVMIRTKPVQQS